MADSSRTWPDGVTYREVAEDLTDWHADVSRYALVYYYNGKSFTVVIAFDPHDPPTTTEGKWARNLLDLSYCPGPMDREHLVKQHEGEKEIAKEIADAIYPTLQRLAGPPQPRSPPTEEQLQEIAERMARKKEEMQQHYVEESHPRDLDNPVTVAEHYFPANDTTFLEVVTKDGTLQVREFDKDPRVPHRVISWDSLREKTGIEPSSLPTFSDEEVVLKTSMDYNVYGVSVPGSDEQLCGKFVVIDQRITITELVKYFKLGQLPLDPEVRIPKLKGLITHGDVGILGFLLTRIPTKHPSLEIWVDREAKLPAVCNPPIEFELPPLPSIPSLDRRQRWMDQVEHTLREMHRHGVTWGGVGPSNVLIDVDDNAWVLDFGDVYRYGWAPEKGKFDTVEGDLELLARLRERLLNLQEPENGGEVKKYVR